MTCANCPGYHAGKEKKCRAYLASRDFYEAFKEVQGFITGRNPKEEQQRTEAQMHCYQHIINEMLGVLYFNQIKRFESITGVKGDDMIKFLDRIRELKINLPQLEKSYQQVQKDLEETKRRAGELEQKVRATNENISQIQRVLS